MAKKSLTYREAGVDIDAGEAFASSIQRTVQSTHGPRVIPRPGGFAGFFSLNFREELFRDTYEDPVLVSCTDGVGTKLKIAFQTGLHHTVGIDLVAMSANDLVVSGARPLFFLDYIATGRVDLEVLQFAIEGIAEGCHQAGMALLGGETAEMPDFYAAGEYDMAGFAVGVVERSQILDGSTTQPGDVLVGLQSSGLHSNGYSLVRAALLQRAKLRLDGYVEELGDYLAEELLKPTRIYTGAVEKVLGHYKVKQVVRAFCHITGGGLPGNLVRVLPPRCDAVVDRSAWEPGPVFRLLEDRGNVDREEMFRVFNMGVGFVAVVSPHFADPIVGHLRKWGYPAFVIGEIRPGEGRVVLEG